MPDGFSRRGRGRPSASLIAGAAIVGVLLATVALAHVLAPYPFDQFHIHDRFSPPSLKYLAGTDEYGRDVFSRVLIGSQLSMTLGLVSTIICMGLGVPIGLLCGSVRGLADELVMRLLDLLMAFPPILLVLLILVVTPPGLLKTSVAIGILFIAPVARLARSLTLDLMNAGFTEAARARGEYLWYLLLCEFLPNMWPTLLVEASLRLVFAVLMGAVLSFLSFGVQPPASDWGLMISGGRAFVDNAPWIALAPGIAMAITVIGISLLGDGLRDRLHPQFSGKG